MTVETEEWKFLLILLHVGSLSSHVLNPNTKVITLGRNAVAKSIRPSQHRFMAIGRSWANRCCKVRSPPGADQLFFEESDYYCQSSCDGR